MTEKHRVVLANDSRLLRSMLRHVIEKAPGLEVVDEVSDLAMLLSVVERTHPHWAIVSLTRDGRMPDVADRLLKRCSSVSVLGMTIDGTVAKVKRVACSERALGHVSLDELLSVLTHNGAQLEADSGSDA